MRYGDLDEVEEEPYKAFEPLLYFINLSEVLRVIGRGVSSLQS